MQYEVLFTKEALKDVQKLPPKLKEKLKTIIRTQISLEPFSGKKLIGDLKGLYSKRLSYKDRILYKIDEKNQSVIILKAKTHYKD